MAKLNNFPQSKSLFTSETLISTNPAQDFQTLGSVKTSSPESIDAAIKAAHNSQLGWFQKGINFRIEALRSLYQLFKEHREALYSLTVSEMGMPIQQAKSEFDFGMGYFEWSLDHAQHMLAPQVTFENENEVHKIFPRPHGVAATILPWNYPFTNFIWGVIQGVLAGNAVVFKHSEEVPLFANELDKLIRQSAIPQGVLQQIFGGHEQGAYLLNCQIDHISFTGSTAIGSEVYKVAANNLNTIVMELGGSDPGFVLEDANLEVTLNSIMQARFSNCGQCCSGLKRLFVHQSMFKPLLEGLIHHLDLLTLGDPSQDTTDMGPLVSHKQQKIALHQFDDALEKGAHIAYQKDLTSHLQGAYIAPTLFTNISTDMKIMKEEVFAPILPIIPFTSLDEAIDLANDTIYGLGAYVFTNSCKMMELLSQRLNVGMIQMNDTEYTRPSNPFGGNKHSGIGRENGSCGFQHVTQPQLISFSKKAHN